jgi:hypothetical protein
MRGDEVDSIDWRIGGSTRKLPIEILRYLIDAVNRLGRGSINGFAFLLTHLVYSLS